MKILIVGSGGREHAIGWKIAQSPRVKELFFAPGNAGTAQIGKNVALGAEDTPGITRFCAQQAVDLVVVGPEAALAAGLVDALNRWSIPAFGPTRLAAEIESSKAFAKAFMQRHAIPTARFAVFARSEDALDYLDRISSPVVVKASGLAAGKGVFLPQTIAEAKEAVHLIMEERAFQEAGDKVIIEERLEGEEFSVLGFTDGRTIRTMPPAQDHKRLLDGDQGPNTGGMGAYASVGLLAANVLAEIEKTILQPAVDGLAAEGRMFQGVLYAGLMMTPDGPKVLEFNCRFGDPETQVILPLLAGDLVETLSACITGRLSQAAPVWKEESAVTVVLASGGYPGKYETGKVIAGLDQVGEDTLVFHAGTRVESEQIVTAGGRVLNVTFSAKTLEQAVTKAYWAIEKIHFDGMTLRGDIAHRALRGKQAVHAAQSAYARAGVSIDAGNQAVALMRNAVKSTYTPAVLAGIGAFGGLFDAGVLKGMDQPVLVASTDGVGTKVSLAAGCGKVESIGKDIVNHCINDILVQGASPLFFLDYFACSHLDPMLVSTIVAGISEACREAGCVLLGGETAEMPGVYLPGEFDVAGTIVGVVEREKILPTRTVAAGDLLLGLASNGPHTNGYSLVRRIFQKESLEEFVPGTQTRFLDALLEPHRSYLPLLRECLALQPSPIKALAHLTGGGFVENIPRVLPEGLRAVIRSGSWPVPPLFTSIQAKGNIAQAEMFRVFNMGIGMVAVLDPWELEQVQSAITEETWVIGELVEGKKGIELL